MKIAIPVTGGMVEHHFGRRDEFAIVDVVDGSFDPSRIEFVDARAVQHDHEGTVELLRRHGVQTVVAGGMGYGIFAALKNAGLEIITGAEGTVEGVAKDFAEGKLVDRGAVHNHHHGPNEGHHEHHGGHHGHHHGHHGPHGQA